jgi:hypothetical protein
MPDDEELIVDVPALNVKLEVLIRNIMLVPEMDIVLPLRLTTLVAVPLRLKDETFIE